MTQSVLLVDYENVRAVEVRALPVDAQLWVFLGARQQLCPVLAKAVRPLGSRFKCIQITEPGKNALDFHLILYLGLNLERYPTAHWTVLSRDKGYDQAIRHLASLGYWVCRAESQVGAFVTPTPPLPEKRGVGHWAQLVVKWQRGQAQPRRPRYSSTLCRHIVNHFNGAVSAEEANQVIEHLAAQDLIRLRNDIIIYRF